MSWSPGIEKNSTLPHHAKCSEGKESCSLGVGSGENTGVRQCQFHLSLENTSTPDLKASRHTRKVQSHSDLNHVKVKGPRVRPLLVAHEVQTHSGQIATFNLKRDRNIYAGPLAMSMAIQLLSINTLASFGTVHNPLVQRQITGRPQQFTTQQYRGRKLVDHCSLQSTSAEAGNWEHGRQSVLNLHISL